MDLNDSLRVNVIFNLIVLSYSVKNKRRVHIKAGTLQAILRIFLVMFDDCSDKSRTSNRLGP